MHTPFRQSSVPQLNFVLGKTRERLNFLEWSLSIVVYLLLTVAGLKNELVVLRREYKLYSCTRLALHIKFWIVDNVSITSVFLILGLKIRIE